MYLLKSNKLITKIKHAPLHAIEASLICTATFISTLHWFPLHAFFSSSIYDLQVMLEGIDGTGGIHMKRLCSTKLKPAKARMCFWSLLLFAYDHVFVDILYVCHACIYKPHRFFFSGSCSSCVAEVVDMI